MSAVDLLSTSILRAVCPERSASDLSPWVEPIKAACRKFEINTIRRVAAFIAQMAIAGGAGDGLGAWLDDRLGRLFPRFVGLLRHVAG